MSDLQHSLLNSLIQAPLLIGDLPTAPCFDRTLLHGSNPAGDLNLNQKLGHLYEDVLSLALKASPDIELLGHNVQIFNEDKQTIGELDFIIQDRRHNAYIHLELGVKFYLAYETPDGWQFPGPNDRDNWPKKLARLQEHQLCLTSNPEGRELLRSRFNINEIEVRQLIYGCLFIPINHTGPAPRLDFMANEARTGQWLYAHQWDEHFSDHKDIYRIPKTLWPVIPNADKRNLFNQYPAKDFTNNFRTTGAMFTTKDCQHTYFLAPDSWPANILDRG